MIIRYYKIIQIIYIITPKDGVIVMQISARNQLKGRIISIELGEVMANIKIQLNNAEIVTAIITRDSVDALELGEQDDVIAVIKATEIMVAKDI